MAKLYFNYGTMNSSKTANALMTHFNYQEVGQRALLCKSETDTRDGEAGVYPPLRTDEYARGRNQNVSLHYCR